MTWCVSILKIWGQIIEQCKFRILSAKPQQSAPVLRSYGIATLVKIYKAQVIVYSSICLFTFSFWGNVWPSFHCRLLGCLILSHPFPMLEFIAHLKELLDYFSFMNDKISTGLISCVLPLTKFSLDLKVFSLNNILCLCGWKRLVRLF